MKTFWWIGPALRQIEFNEENSKSLKSIDQGKEKPLLL